MPTPPTPKATASRALGRRAFSLALAAAALFAAPAPSARAAHGDWQVNEQSKVRLVTPYEEAPTRGEIRLGLQFETVPGWHVYWKNAGDAGYPPAVDATPTPQLSDVEILWPAPQRYGLPGDLVAFGYEGEAVYPLRGWIDASGPYVKLVLDLDYLVCEVDCVPYSYRLSVDQPLAPADGVPTPDPEVGPLLAAWEARVPRPAETLAGVATSAGLDLRQPEEPMLEVRVEGARTAGTGTDGTAPEGSAPDLFLETHDLFDTGPPTLSRDAAALVFRVPLAFRQHPDELPKASDFAWTVTGLVDDDGRPLAIHAARTVEARLPVSPRPAAESPTPVGTAPSLASLLLLALLGGLLLHLTPTLLPLLAARLARLGEVADARTAAAARRGALLTAAGCLAGAVALDPLAAAARDAGFPAAWGAQLQEPVFVAAQVLAATLMTLVLWGFVPRLRRRDAEPGSGGAHPILSFALGLGTVFLALAWNLPPLSRALGAALAAGREVAFATFLALGAGLALPHLVAALRLAPACRRPSRRVVEGLGFLAAGGSLWLLFLLSGTVSPEGLAYVQLALLGLAMAAWLGSAARHRSWGLAWTLALLLLAGTVLWLADASRREVGRAAFSDTELSDREFSDTPTPVSTLPPTAGGNPRCTTASLG